MCVYMVCSYYQEYARIRVEAVIREQLMLQAYEVRAFYF